MSQSQLLGQVCFISTMIAVHTCLQIEYSNARAGGYLPRTDYGHGNPKWRVAAPSMERKHFYQQVGMQESQRILERRGKLTAEEQAALDSDSWPLTAIQEAELNQTLEKNYINSTLRSWVNTWGLFQYLVAPFALISSVALLIFAKSNWRRLGFAFLTVFSGVSMGMMLHREYFTSLGW